MTTPNRLTLGTAQLGMRYGGAARAPDRRCAFEILSAAAALGVGGLDTAPGYGEAEERIGAFLKRGPAPFAITTKLPALPAGIEAHALRGHVERGLTGSLRRLGVERVECCLVHRAADLALHGRALVHALEALVERGRIARAGVSAYDPDEALLAARWPGLDVVQHPLSLLDRRLAAGGVLAELGERRIEVEARSVLLQGLLCAEPDAPAAARLGAGPVLARLRALLDGAGLRAAEAALPYAFAAGARRAVIGVDTPAQLESAVASLARALPEAVSAALAALPEPDPRIVDPRRWPPS